MKLTITNIACSILLVTTLVTACQKEHYTSRDTSGLRPLPPPPPPPPPDPTSISFNNADALDNWETAGNKGAIEKPGAKEGQGWLKASIVNGEDYMHFIFRRPTPLNPGLTKANGALKLWVYIGDISQIKADGQFELTSSGESDKNEYNWNLAPMLPNLKNGWNELTLNFSDAGESSGDGGPTLTAFNFFRLYLWTTGKTHADVALGLDDLRLIQKP